MALLKYPFLVVCGLSVLLLTACSSIINSHRQKEPMMTAYLAGQTKTVAGILDEKLKKSETFNSSVVDSGDEVAWRLEAGSFYFLQGNSQASLDHFNRTENLIAEFDRRAVISLRDVSAEGGALLTNQNALPYRGWCRDRVLFPFFKALDYLGKKDEAGFRVELFHIREVQNKVISDYQEYFKEETKAIEREKKNNSDNSGNVDVKKIMSDSDNHDLNVSLDEAKKIANKGYGNFLNPMTIFMSGYGYLRDQNAENAIVDFERLYKAMPKHPQIRSYYRTMLQKTGRSVPGDLQSAGMFDFPLDRENVLVIFANGRSAALRQIALYIPIIFPGYCNIITAAWPVCEYYPAPYSCLTVGADGKEWKTWTIADMDGILSQEYMDRLPGMITRLVLNVVAKEAASYLAVRAANQADPAAGVAVMLTAAVYKAVFNTADTRSWEMLPKEFQIVQLPMPQSRKLLLSLPGMKTMDVTFSSAAKSAILYVNAPSSHSNSISIQNFELTTK